MTVAIAYYRVSGLGQKAGDGIPRQKEAAEEVCSTFAYTLVHEYCDGGKSGDIAEHGFISEQELAHREQFLEMLRDLRDKKYGDDVVVVLERLDRLARWQPIQEVLVCELSQTGAKITTKLEGDGLETTDPVKVFIRQIMGAVAQLDKSNIVEKLRHARKAKKKAGHRVEGKIPYGEHPAHPEEAATKALILNLAEQGLGSSDIADELNAQGLRTRHGKQWRSGTVWKIIRRYSTPVPVQT